MAFPAPKVYAHVTENHLASACTHTAEFARPGGATHEPPPAAHALVQLWPLLPNCQWALPQWPLTEPWDSLRPSGSWSACAWLLIGDGDQRCFARSHLSTAELVRFESCCDDTFLYAMTFRSQLPTECAVSCRICARFLEV